MKKVEHKVPNEVIPQTGKPEIHHNLPEEVWDGISCILRVVLRPVQTVNSPKSQFPEKIFP